MSGDRIGSTFADAPNQADQVYGAYLSEIDFWRRASALRGVLFDALWPHAPPEDDERIEAELAARYWRSS